VAPIPERLRAASGILGNIVNSVTLENDEDGSRSGRRTTAW
jgi:hypothetical protein